ncbi:hypothetical protein [Andreprevotia chitinilytica]|uniref:hypothetical protein n=1 Tax=Andreprevotia chitinilytica TaxID=396808 RepID=UPI0012EBA8C0|nr:hypothetical protein [Andreprevotia chitinilytica]
MRKVVALLSVQRALFVGETLKTRRATLSFSSMRRVTPLPANPPYEWWSGVEGV